MRDGLKKRIANDKPNTANVFAYKRISKNSYNKRVANVNCVSNGCSNVQDASGYWIGNKQSTQQTSRNYYAPFRQPVKGYRQTINCTSDSGLEYTVANSPSCFLTTEVFKDNYAHNATSATSSTGTCNTPSGSISTSKTPLMGSSTATRSSSGNATRTNKPLIRSGMQPNVAGQQNSGLAGSKTATRYSYSYRELINNRRKDTYMKKLATQQPASGIKTTTGYGGKCSTEGICGETQYGLNNDKFKVQGAVESSDRITRLKLDTIRGSTKCSPSKYINAGKDYQSICNGVYSTGNLQTSRTKAWPLESIPGGYHNNAQVKYTAIFNTNHTEVNYPQTSALARVRGSVSHKTSVNPNGGVCCNKPPQLLM